VVTGVGLVSPVGIGTEETWKSLQAGRSGAGPITLFDASQHSSRFACEVKGFDPLRWVEKKEVKKMDRFIQFAVAAADFALEDSGLKVDAGNNEMVGVYIGSGIGGFATIEREHTILMERGPSRISPFFIPAAIVNLASGWISIRSGAKGPNSATCTACTTSAHAIGDSYRLIQRGDADAMIAGGSEAAITPLGVGGFAAMRALSTRNDQPEKASRPFDADRDGFVPGEGAATLVLESLEHALSRGARIRGEVIGFGITDDAFHAVAPDETGQAPARCMTNALADAGIRPEDVDYVNAHGTSTQLNDAAETRALKLALGEHAYKVPISSTKSMIGHLLGGAGAVEAVATLLTIDRGIIHPTINLENPDPACDLDYVPNEARQTQVEVALSNAMGLGGHNGCVLVGRVS
jgi:3-oxoacyl-[acyl-carrier-protein] synthase II